MLSRMPGFSLPRFAQLTPSTAKPQLPRFGATEPPTDTFNASGTVDILHRNHPDLQNAVTILTKGASTPSMAFRMNHPFTLTSRRGEHWGGDAGDYLMIHSTPEGTVVTPELVEQLLNDGGKRDEGFTVTVIDADMMHQSYSHEPKSPNLIANSGSEPEAGKATPVYKAADLPQKALIPKPNQTELISLESEKTGTTQQLGGNKMVLLDVGGNPYPKKAESFLRYFKPVPGDSSSEAFFEEVKSRYGLS